MAMKSLDRPAWLGILKHMINNKLDHSFQALADPSRRAMVERLAAGPASVSELAKPLPISLAAVMQHLKLLEESGLVTSSKQGRVRTCRIEPAALARVERWVAERRALWEQSLGRLGQLLGEDR
jgi:DNA-binding transcriptional ArsR family regulator